MRPMTPAIYANRTVVGLSVTAKGDILDLAPNNSTGARDGSHRQDCNPAMPAIKPNARL